MWELPVVQQPSQLLLGSKRVKGGYQGLWVQVPLIGSLGPFPELGYLGLVRLGGVRAKPGVLR